VKSFPRLTLENRILSGEEGRAEMQLTKIQTIRQPSIHSSNSPQAIWITWIIKKIKYFIVKSIGIL
jgi:hypothetical protein